MRHPLISMSIDKIVQKTHFSAQLTLNQTIAVHNPMRFLIENIV